LIAPLEAPSMNSRILPVIIVTAQKQIQRLQNVPIAINVISPEILADFGIDTFEEMEQPGLQVGAAGRADNVFIRGVGSGLNSGFEQSVPFYIDSIYHGRARVQRLAFFDMAGIEVLKGPQPTYFGKNAIGGAIALRTRRPTDKFEGSLEVTHEFEHNETTEFAVLSGSLGESIKARVAIKHRSLDKGWLKNEVENNRSEPKQEDLLGRLTLLWNPTESLEVFTKFELASDNWDGRHAQLVSCTPMAPIDFAIDSCLFDKKTAVTYDPGAFGALGSILSGKAGDIYVSNFDYLGGQVSANWIYNSYGITSVTSYYEYNESVFFKADVNSLQLVGADLPEKFDQLSQELRILSPRGMRFEWVGGLYYDTSTLFTANPAIFKTANGFNGFETRMNAEKAKSWAIFAELGYDIIPVLTAKFGFRYTEVKKNADYNFSTFSSDNSTSRPTLVQLSGFKIEASRKENDFQPSVVLEWRPENNYLFYGSWKKGFKAGGFDHAAQSPDRAAFEFSPEHVTAYELGAKLLLFNGEGSLNIAVFRSEFHDLQVTQFDASQVNFRTSNAARAVSQGLEVDAAWMITDYLTLNATLNRLDAKFKRFSGAQCYDNPPQSLADGCAPTGQVDSLGNMVFAQELAGTSLPYAAKWSGSFRAYYRRPFNQRIINQELDFVFQFDLLYTSSFNTNNRGDPDQIQDAYSKVDLRIGLAHEDDNWEVAFVGRNLTDKFTTHWIQDTPLSAGQSNFALLDRTRQLGVQVRINF